MKDVRRFDFTGHGNSDDGLGLLLVHQDLGTRRACGMSYVVMDEDSLHAIIRVNLLVL